MFDISSSNKQLHKGAIKKRLLASNREHILFLCKETACFSFGMTMGGPTQDTTKTDVKQCKSQ